MPDAITPIPVSETDYAHHSESYGGICIGCRKWTGEMCEPDAHERPCPECHTMTVYGAEEALVQGLIEIADVASES